MAHGVPDWDDRTRLDVVFGFKDDAELAVRLGAWSRYHRLGKTVFQDDFRDGLGKWIYNASAGIAEVTLVDTPLEVGPQAAELFTRANNGWACTLWHEMGSALSDVVAVELDFMLLDTIKSFRVQLYLYDQAGYYPFGVEFEVDTNIILYAQMAGVYRPLAWNLTDYIILNRYNTFKLAVSRLTNDYLWCMINGERLDMAGYQVAPMGGSTPPKIKTLFALYSTVEDDAMAYVDSARITLEEER